MLSCNAAYTTVPADPAIWNPSGVGRDFFLAPEAWSSKLRYFEYSLFASHYIQGTTLVKTGVKSEAMQTDIFYPENPTDTQSEHN